LCPRLAAAGLGNAEETALLSDRIVLTMSLDPALDRGICGNAHKTLSLIRSLAGHGRRLVTLTCSLARQLGRCTNTVRNHYRELEEAGYLWWQSDRRTGLATLYVREAVEAPSRRARLEAERQAEAQAELERRVVDHVLEAARRAAGAVCALGGSHRGSGHD
jgi:DNA-binding transcriptional regulator YhcF (GntR family)